MGLLCQSKHPPHLHIQLRAQRVGIPSRKSIARLSSKETGPKHKRTDSNMDVAFTTTESPHHSGIWGAWGLRGLRKLILCPFLLKWNLLSPGASRAVLLRREKGKTCGHHALLQQGRAELLIRADLSRDQSTPWAESVPHRVANYNSPARRNFCQEIE